MKNKLISVIVPIFNTNKEYLEKCVESIIEQTYKELEIILVNDGSNEETQLFCNDLLKLDSRIVLYNNENHGVSWTRNYGVSKSSGSYISFIDSDDILEKQMYEILMKNIIENDCEISACGYNYIELDGKKYSKFGSENKIIYKQNDAIISMFDEESFGVSVWNKLFKRELLEKVKFNEQLKINEDRLFLFECICNCNCFVYEDICLYNYIKRENSSTTCKFSKNRLDVLLVNNYIYEYVLEKYKNNSLINSKFLKNECIYLIRLYRDLMLGSNRNEYKENRICIKNRIKKIFKMVKKQLNSFEHIEGLIITKIDFLYLPVMRLLTKFVVFKKIKNKFQRKDKKNEVLN